MTPPDKSYIHAQHDAGAARILLTDATFHMPSGAPSGVLEAWAAADKAVRNLEAVLEAAATRGEDAVR